MKENGESVKVESQRGLGFRHGAIGGIEKCERLDGFGIGKEISLRKLEDGHKRNRHESERKDKRFKRRKREKDEKKCKKLKHNN